MLYPRSRLLLFVITTSILFSAVAQGGVKVVKKPAVVEHKTFDPSHPPADMPPLHGDESAVTSYVFDCSIGLSYTPRVYDLASGKRRATYHIQSVEATIGLHVTVWLPKGAQAKLTAHEEGHRQIAEDYYKNAEHFAKLAANQLDGRRIEREGPDCKRQAEQALNDANQQADQYYLNHVARPCERAQIIYDKITGHGAKLGVNEKDAIAKAIARQVDEAKSASSTQPTTKQ